MRVGCRSGFLKLIVFPRFFLLLRWRNFLSGVFRFFFSMRSKRVSMFFNIARIVDWGFAFFCCCFLQSRYFAKYVPTARKMRSFRNHLFFFRSLFLGTHLFHQLNGLSWEHLEGGGSCWHFFNFRLNKVLSQLLNNWDIK